jgi:hypothetical protein
MTGINKSTGLPLCSDIKTVSNAVKCDEGKYLKGIDSEGKEICEPLPGDGDDAKDGTDGADGAPGIPAASGTSDAKFFSSGKQLKNEAGSYTITLPLEPTVRTVRGNIKANQGYKGTTEIVEFSFIAATATFNFNFLGFHCSTAGSFTLSTNNSYLQSMGQAAPSCSTSATNGLYTTYIFLYNSTNRTLSIKTILRYTGSDARAYGYTTGAFYLE